ncbi:glycoside hydrolase family 127 protein [Caulobacter segnis]
MKLYSTPVDSFWCCTGTGMENHAKYRDSIYFHDGQTLYVNLLIPSKVAWKAHDATLTQTTTFPDEPTTTLRWGLKRPTALTLKLRHPGWSRTATVLVNGKVALRSQTPGLLEVARTWKDGDTVELRLEMRTGVETDPASKDIAAFTYGPLVLAGALGTEGLAPGADIVVNERLYGKYNDGPFTPPTLSGEPASVAARIRPTGKPLEFTVTSAEGGAVRLVPYHRIAHERYATYWRLSGA